MTTKYIVIYFYPSVNAGVYNSNLMAGQDFLETRAKVYMFKNIQRVFYQRSHPTKQNLGI